MGQNALIGLIDKLFDAIFGSNSGTLNTLPFPEYEDLPGTVNALPSPPVGPFPPYPPGDYCTPLQCSFVEQEPFNLAVDIQVGAFRRHVLGMRDSVERVRQAYRAVQHDVLQAIKYHELTR